jgi:predicted transcriptional regulator
MPQTNTPATEQTHDIGQPEKPESAQTTEKQPKQPKSTTKSPQNLRPRSARANKIIELKETNPALTVREIATLTNCDHSNVVRVLQRYGIVAQEVNEFKDHRAEVLAGLQHRLIQSITSEDIKKAPLGTRVLAAAQLYDKERIERGLSNGDQPIMVIIRDKPQPVQVEGKVVDIPKVEQDNLLISPET